MNENCANLIVSFFNQFPVLYRSLILVNSLTFQAHVTTFGRNKGQRFYDMRKYKEESVLIC